VKLVAEVQPGHQSSFSGPDGKRALYIEKKLERVCGPEDRTWMELEVHAPKSKIETYIAI
jgi:hypothetical protein